MTKAQKQRMEAQGWKAPTKRPECRNCAHGVEVNYSYWNCTLGDFETRALAVCDKHKGKGAS